MDSVGRRALRSRDEENTVAVVQHAADFVPAHLDGGECAVLLLDDEPEHGVSAFLVPPYPTRDALHSCNLPGDSCPSNTARAGNRLLQRRRFPYE
jgi:hypothetical protein